MSKRPSWWDIGEEVKVGEELVLGERTATNAPIPVTYSCFFRILADGEREPVPMRDRLRLSLTCPCHPVPRKAAYEIWTLDKPGFPSITMLIIVEKGNEKKRGLIREVDLETYRSEHTEIRATVLPDDESLF